MVTSEIEIYNLALMRLGAEMLRDPQEDNNEGRACRASYPRVVSYLLSNYWWTFARATAPITKEPREHPVYDFIYHMPSDCLTPMFLSERRELDRWEVEGRYIVTNVNTSWLWYVKKIDNVSLFTASFVQAVAVLMEADIALAITNDKKLAGERLQKAMVTVQEFYRDDAMIGNDYKRTDGIAEFDRFVNPYGSPLFVSTFYDNEEQTNT